MIVIEPPGVFIDERDSDLVSVDVDTEFAQSSCTWLAAIGADRLAGNTGCLTVISSMVRRRSRESVENMGYCIDEVNGVGVGKMRCGGGLCEGERRASSVWLP